MSADRFLYSERELAKTLGVPREKLRSIRQDDLERGAHWENVGGEVRYSESGHTAVLAVLQVPAPAPAFEKNSAPNEAPRPPVPSLTRPAAPEVAGVLAMAPHTAAQLQPPARPGGEVVDLTVHKCYVPNRKILEAKRADGVVVLVRVRDSRNLRPGMTMKCRIADGRIYELAQRLPRYPGRW